jgi:type III restriction enzyme
MDLPKGRMAYLRKNASLFQKLLVYRSAIMPTGVLRFCLEYADSSVDRIGGVFESIRRNFRDLRGPGLLPVLAAVYDFRNKYVAHQDEELKDGAVARVALKQWIELLVRLDGLFVKTV